MPSRHIQSINQSSIISLFVLYQYKYVYIIYIFQYREFIQKQYPAIKSANPTLPILIREVSGIEPKLYARYGNKK